jgi:AcrR family transcriptional regulator
LVEAAPDLFDAHGYDDVTIAPIAGHTDITCRSYFRWFPDKCEVFSRDPGDCRR